ncbi:uncharacterized protein N7496_012052 [Penicillium cataractarum]|uniref:Uncharacterized protein n=1 Tax=Penicillium cataractarum TaxID=2100454 RepID=A0A9W9RHY3_9EURO|nr:uncharacterized protein N7496_012052 [Penicillium cataractarum]KAJ5359639.1 hypothetical protein N7496_012052 [Penicillium cataractarum]
MMAIGGVIGPGYFMGMGTGLSTAGPAGLLICFAIVGLLLWFVIQSLGELGSFIAVSGSFAHYSARFIDPAWGFALGWNYFLLWAGIIMAEYNNLGLVLSYWETDMPRWGWILVFWVVLGDRRGKDSKWAEISKRLPGRTNKDCRKRWFHSLDPALRRGRWTKEEDEILLAAHQRLGPAWKEIALLIEGRDILNPLAKDRLKDWSPEEDQYLTAKVNELGHRWATIAAGLPGRPPLTCRNRWRRLSKDLSNMSGLSSAELTSSPDALPSSASTSTPRDYDSLSSQAMDTQTPSDSHRLESDFTNLSPGVSENPALSPLFSIGDISSSVLGNPPKHQVPLVSHAFNHSHNHENIHEIDPKRSNTTPLTNTAGHNVPFPGQPPRPVTLPQQEDYYDCDSLWELLNSVDGNSGNVSSIFPTQETQAEPQDSMPGIQDNQRTSIEEAAILQVLSSTRDPSSMPNDALSTINAERATGPSQNK